MLRLFETALLLGAYVLLAGAYGIAYCLDRLKANAFFRVSATAAYAMHVIVFVGIAVLSPLAVGWKALLFASTVVICFIPPITYRYLEQTHGAERLKS
jgi:hypothetical protein